MSSILKAEPVKGAEENYRGNIRMRYVRDALKREDTGKADCGLGLDCESRQTLLGLGLINCFSSGHCPEAAAIQKAGLYIGGI